MHCRNDHSTFLGSHNNKHLSVMKFKFMMNSDVRQSSVQNQASISVQHFLKSDPIFEGEVVAHITNT